MTNQLTKQLGIFKSDVSEFNSLASAKNFADRCTKIQMIVLGEGGKFWVCVNRVAVKLTKAGYELAE
jgi:hypothetical protein